LPTKKPEPEDDHTNGEKVAGILLILLAMIFTSLQARRKQMKIFHIIIFR
jgi:hypothetical protein